MSLIPIPSSAAADVQNAFRKVDAQLLKVLGVRNVDFGGRRIINAGDAVNPQDYLTKGAADAALAALAKKIPVVSTTTPVSGVQSDYYGTHAARLAKAPGSLPLGTFWTETEDRHVVYQVQLVAGVRAWVYVTGIYRDALGSRPADLAGNDNGFLFKDKDTGIFHRWSGAAWHWWDGIIRDVFANRPTAAAGLVDQGVYFTATDMGYQTWITDATLGWVLLQGWGGPMRGTLSPNLKPTLTTNDVGFLFYSTDFDRTYRWSGTAWADAPGAPQRGQITYFDVSNMGAPLPATAWQLVDGTASVTLSTPTGGTTTTSVPNLTTLNRFMRSVAGATGGGGGAATTHTHAVDPPNTASGNDIGTVVGVQIWDGVAGHSIAVPAEPHTHQTNIASFASAGPSGTSGADALPPYLDMRPYVRL